MSKSQLLLTSLVGALPCGAMFALLVWMWMSKMATFGDMPTMFHVFAGITVLACAVGAFVIPIGILLQKAPEYGPVAVAAAGAAPGGSADETMEAGDYDDADEDFGSDDDDDDFADDDDFDDDFDDFDDDEF